MRKPSIVAVSAGIILWICCFAFGQETPAQRDARMQWWRDARFGLFIHWGSIRFQPESGRGAPNMPSGFGTARRFHLRNTTSF